jgi:hypothetical protein
MRDPKLALAHLLLASINIRRSDYSEELVELDAYLRLEPEGPRSDQAREAQEYAKRKLAGLWPLSRRHGPNLERFYSSV